MGWAKFQLFDFLICPVTKTVTNPTTVVLPIAIAVFLEPRERATMQVEKAKTPMINPNIWPRLASEDADCKAAFSIPRWCFASSSAIINIRSAAPGTIWSYRFKTSGCGSGPENCCVTCVICPFGGFEDNELLGIGGLFFLFLLMGKSVDSTFNMLTSALPMPSHSFASTFFRDKATVVGGRRYIHNATDTFQNMLKLLGHTFNIARLLDKCQVKASALIVGLTPWERIITIYFLASIPYNDLHKLQIKHVAI